MDTTLWRYYAQIPQTPNPQDPEHFSLLDHLRHLLAADPTLDHLNLPGGLVAWLTRNTEKVLEWTGSARDDWTAGSAIGERNMASRLLDYLDGANYVDQDVPGTPILVNPTIAPVGLLMYVQQGTETPPPYIYHINIHLNGVVNSPGATATQRHLAGLIDTYLNYVRQWLEKVRDDVRQILTMPDANLLKPHTQQLLDEMETYANYAYVGKLDPVTNQVQGGVVQIGYVSQSIAMLQVLVYKG
jgi:hypothetical protein